MALQAIIAAGSIVAMFTLAYQIYKDGKKNKWSQAKNVSAWIQDDIVEVKYAGREYTEIVIINNESTQPIYDVVLSIHYIGSGQGRNGEYSYEHNSIVPPGRWITEIDWLCTDIYEQYNVTIAFRDSNGYYWFRRADGVLTIDKEEVSKERMKKAILTYKIRRCLN